MRKEKARRDGNDQEKRIFCTEKIELASWTSKMDLEWSVGQSDQLLFHKN